MRQESNLLSYLLRLFCSSGCFKKPCFLGKDSSFKRKKDEKQEKTRKNIY